MNFMWGQEIPNCHFLITINKGQVPYKLTLDPDVLHVALITLLGLDNDRRESITDAHTATRLILISLQLNYWALTALYTFHPTECLQVSYVDGTPARCRAGSPSGWSYSICSCNMGFCHIFHDCVWEAILSTSDSQDIGNSSHLNFINILLDNPECLKKYRFSLSLKWTHSIEYRKMWKCMAV